MGLADLHIHTAHSYDGTCSVSAVLKHVADHTALNVIAVTDHNTMAGVNEALRLAPAYGIEVVPGCEISTAEGHLLALFIDRPVQAGLSLVETVLAVGRQGGLCIAAHPMARGASSLSFPAIYAALAHPGVNKTLVGIEAFNGGLVYTRRNTLVEALAKTTPLAQVGNSDAHVLLTIGQGATEFEGSSTRELRTALEQGKTRVQKGKGLDGLGVVRSYFPRYLLRKLGWVAYNAHPGAPLTYARLGRALQGSPKLAS